MFVLFYFDNYAKKQVKKITNSFFFLVLFLCLLWVYYCVHTYERAFCPLVFFFPQFYSFFFLWTRTYTHITLLVFFLFKIDYYFCFACTENNKGGWGCVFTHDKKKTLPWINQINRHTIRGCLTSLFLVLIFEKNNNNEF